MCSSDLPGITRKSSIQLLRDWGFKVSERRITIQELAEANDQGRVMEAFGTGTAAVISPIGELKWEEKQMVFNGGKIGALTQQLYDTLTGIQYGKLEDPHGWSVFVCKA